MGVCVHGGFFQTLLDSSGLLSSGTDLHPQEKVLSGSRLLGMVWICFQGKLPSPGCFSRAIAQDVPKMGRAIGDPLTGGHTPEPVIPMGLAFLEFRMERIAQGIAFCV